MAQKSIYEFDAKKILAKELPKYYPNFNYHNKLLIVDSTTNFDKVTSENPWLKTERMVVKPDQLF
ncbi:MAG: ATPase, partial [Candidatus Hermodarchaeota archaeon]